MGKLTIKAVAGVIVVFLLGVATGIIGTGIAVRHGIRELTERAPDTHRNIVMRRLTRELKLTKTQLPQVETIVQSGGQEIRNLLYQSHNEFAAILQRKTTEMKAILTPEQQQQLDRILERLQKRWPPLPQ
ncbi:hypothetical protein U14_02762 [Candidatus Moduliflexus flocculans]|uniref:Periplasmic heavy metal sensor n=1 Tax=Candidatus Moduliflexus flocculans TaxID=1499966 RepID=A0A081BMA1_9BACT|nr:hypothetical protein U14_02762 [Candidatus Moduliflexus flocculans]